MEILCPSPIVFARYIIAFFFLAFLFFWAAVSPRVFEYPAASTQIRDHAAALTIWHHVAKTHDKKIDDQVVNDLRLFMINQLSEANQINLVVVRKRLAARSNTIIWMFAGFAFVMASEITIFLSKHIGLAGA